MMNEIIKEEFEKTLENVDPSSVVRVRILLHCIFVIYLLVCVVNQKKRPFFHLAYVFLLFDVHKRTYVRNTRETNQS